MSIATATSWRANNCANATSACSNGVMANKGAKLSDNGKMPARGRVEFMATKSAEKNGETLRQTYHKLENSRVLRSHKIANISHALFLSSNDAGWSR